jgi:hypothetical protein
MFPTIFAGLHPGTFAATAIYFLGGKQIWADLMQRDHWTNNNNSKRWLNHPPVVAIAVAVFGVLAMLIVDHGPWTRPAVQTAEVANYRTTGEAARAIGATVTPTAPKPALEPDAPGPKPAQTPNPITP